MLPRLLLAFLCAGAFGCIFDARSPEPPLGQSVPWKNPTVTDSVLENVRVTFNAKSVANYSRSLADDFTFEPDLGDVSEIGETFFAGWTKAKEETAMSEILNSAGNINFTWTPHGEPLDVPDQPDERYYEDIVYTMKFHKSTPVPADTTLSGKANLYMREDGGLWAIYKWVDIRDGSGNATLGMARFKGRVVY